MSGSRPLLDESCERPAVMGVFGRINVFALIAIAAIGAASLLGQAGGPTAKPVQVAYLSGVGE